MAFINCSHCNTRISDVQDECPNCGQPLNNKLANSKSPNIGYGLFYIVMSFVLGAATYNYLDSIDTINAFLNEMDVYVNIDNRVPGFMVLSYGVMALTVISFFSGILSILKSANSAHVIVFLSVAVYVCMALLINDGDFFKIDDSRFVPHSAIRATICLHLALWPTLAISAINALIVLTSKRNR